VPPATCLPNSQLCFCICEEESTQTYRKVMKVRRYGTDGSVFPLFPSTYSSWNCLWQFGPAFPQSESEAHNFRMYKSNGPFAVAFLILSSRFPLHNSASTRPSFCAAAKDHGRFIEGFCNAKGGLQTWKSIMELAYGKLNLTRGPKLKGRDCSTLFCGSVFRAHTSFHCFFFFPVKSVMEYAIC